MANKVAVGLDFYDDLNAVAPTYEFQQDDVDEATAIQAGVTEDTATIAVPAAQTDTFVANFNDGSGPTDPTDPGHVVTTDLTAGTDLPGGAGGGADTQGKAATDTFAGTVLQNETGSLLSADVIDGGEGTDTFAIRVIDTGTDRLAVTTFGRLNDNAITTINGTSGFEGLECSSATSSLDAVGFANGKISSVEIASTDSNDEVNVIRGITSGSGNDFAFGHQNGPSNFSLTGSQDLIITAEAGVSLTASDNECGFETGVNLNGSAATGDLRIAGSSVADAIQGGIGNDILYGLGGDDALTGNAGMDQFRISDWSGTDTINDFVRGVDVVGFGRSAFFNTTATTEGATLSTDNYIENVQNLGAMSLAEDNTLVELQAAASETQIETTLANTINTQVLVFNSTSNKGEIWYDSNWNDLNNGTRLSSFPIWLLWLILRVSVTPTSLHSYSKT